jgi:hypothetical protein
MAGTLVSGFCISRHLRRPALSFHSHINSLQRAPYTSLLSHSSPYRYHRTMATARRRIHGDSGKSPDTAEERKNRERVPMSSHSHSHGIFGRHSHSHEHDHAHGGGLIETLQSGGAHVTSIGDVSPPAADFHPFYLVKAIVAAASHSLGWAQTFC